MRLLLPFLLFCFHLSTAQLQCKTRRTSTKAITTCLHENGKLASEEIWDLNHTHGQFAGFSNSGEKLFTYYPHTVGGHASVIATYHPNGQLSQVEFRGQPDGGIQREHEIREYAPNGHLILFRDLSYPTKLQWPFKQEITTDTPVVKHTTKPAECGEIWLSILEVVNTTKRPVRIELSRKSSSTPPQSFTIQPKETLRVDSVIQAQYFCDPLAYLNWRIVYKKAEGMKELLFEKNGILEPEHGRQIHRYKIIYKKRSS